MKHTWHDRHIVLAFGTLLRSLYITLGIFVILFVIFHIGRSLYVSWILDKQSNAFEAGIAQDQEYLKIQGDAISQNNQLVDSIVHNNRDHLLEILKTEGLARSIQRLGAADRDGVVMGRTANLDNYGDNVFLNSPTGRAVALGKAVQSIELTGFGNQIFLTTARPVMKSDEMIGALFASRFLDDEYALQFRDQYLNPGTQIAFYSKDHGIFGDSFTNPNTQKLVYSYFNTGSDWIKSGDSNKTISFDDDTAYIVKNIVFPGLEQSPGGVLIFIPRINISNFANVVTAVLTLLVFLFLALRLHSRMPSEERGRHYYILLFGASLIAFGLAYLAFHSQNFGRFRLEHIPYILYNSTIRLQPESRVYSLGFEQHLTVVVDTGDEPVNVVQISLKFDPEAVEMKSLDVENSVCTYVVENTIDQKAGTALFTCGILHPTVGQGSISIVDLNVLPRRVGTFEIAFDEDETKVLANDGLGTNVLRMAQNSTYQVEIFNSTLNEKTSVTADDQPLVVFSTTHSNESRWYNLPKANFVWQGMAGDVYRYAFDSSPKTIPTNEHTTQDTRVGISVPGDGIYYFHLQRVTGGPIAHYRLRSDMTPPIILGMNLSQEKIIEGDVVRFSFSAEDSSSSIQRNYYVDLGDHLFLPIGQELFVPFLDAGDQKITLRVFDNAGNYSENTKTVRVEKKSN